MPTNTPPPTALRCITAHAYPGNSHYNTNPHPPPTQHIPTHHGEHPQGYIRGQSECSDCSNCAPACPCSLPAHPQNAESRTQKAESSPPPTSSALAGPPHSEVRSPEPITWGGWWCCPPIPQLELFTVPVKIILGTNDPRLSQTVIICSACNISPPYTLYTPWPTLFDTFLVGFRGF